MTDVHYLNPKLAQIYDIDSPWSVDREFYFRLAGESKKTILDLGCGTGLICDAYAAAGHDVTGMDPAGAMLEQARKKPLGDEIEWVQSTAQEFSSNKRFDLIIMTGHAFQVLLTDSEISKMLAVMREHLKPDGIFVFESRNPTIDWTAQWNYVMNLDTPFGTVKESRILKSFEKGLMTFELVYQLPDETLISTSELRFTSNHDIKRFVSAAGLKIQKIFGDWDERPFEKNNSAEMIFFVSKNS